MREESKKYFIEEGLFTEEHYPILVKLTFSTLSSIRESSREDFFSINSVEDDSIRYLVGFDPVVIYEKLNLSTNPVDIMSFDNTCPETNIVQGRVLKGNEQDQSTFFQWM